MATRLDRIGRRRLLKVSALGAAASAFLSACGGDDKGGSQDAATSSTRVPTAAASEVQTGGNLQYGASRDVTTLDPHFAALSEETVVNSGLFDGSLTYNDDSQLVARLAERFEYPDNTTLVMTYRSGVVFHDGQPFSAASVKANFDRYLAPATGTPGGPAMSRKIAKIETLDDRTVRFTLTRPDATALAGIGLIRMISPAAIERYGKDLARNPIGTGAFKYKEWLKDDHVTMERFEQYWDSGKAPVRVPRLDAFTFKPIVEPTVMVANLRTKSIHVAGAIQAADFERVKSEQGVVAVERRASSSYRIYVNLRSAPTDQLRVRQALAMAVDREAVGKAAFFGLGQPARSVFSPTHWMYPKDRPPLRRDLAGAKAKLNEAGFPQGVKVEMIVPASEPYRTVAQVLQASFAEAGITVGIKQMESAQAIEAMKRGEAHLYLGAIANRDDPDGFFSGHFKSDAAFNFAGFNDPEFEKALADALLLTDQEQRRPLYLKAEHRIFDEVPGIFLYNPPSLHAHVREVQEFRVLDFVGAVYDTTWLKKS